jgi:hypothetical protein
VSHPVLCTLRALELSAPSQSLTQTWPSGLKPRYAQSTLYLSLLVNLLNPSLPHTLSSFSCCSTISLLHLHSSLRRLHSTISLFSVRSQPSLLPDYDPIAYPLPTVEDVCTYRMFSCFISSQGAEGGDCVCLQVFQPGAKTETFCRWSAVTAEHGTADSQRDIRGMALKFYTEQGEIGRSV